MVDCQNAGSNFVVAGVDERSWLIGGVSQKRTVPAIGGKVPAW